ncbi:MAG: Gfo/Idh/MocA family oxidoreductase [Clostridia bacterium]|nr:Gfo/Idh/MocA family oxidoreductase [Clostridia bacterium]
MLRVAMLSKWHVHAAGYARDIIASGKAEIAAIWDNNAERGKEWANELNVDFEPDLDVLLARNDIDAVICCTPTTMHDDVLVKAADAGKHIFTEKALSTTVEGCEKISNAIKRNGVTFTISYPQLFNKPTKLIKKYIDSGKIGKVTTVRIRNAHSGVSNGWLPEYWFEEKDAGGGAMMDLGCHPMYQLAYLCGKPKRISALFNSPLGSKVDENAVSIIEFENGIIGISETGFDSYSSPHRLEVYGTDGTIIEENWNIKIKTKETAEFSDSFIEPKADEADISPLNKFIDACINNTGTPEGLGTEEATALTLLLENAYISDKTNKTVIL